MKIASVHNNSIAAQLGLQPDDKILTINGHKISDILDFKFWIYTSEKLSLSIERKKTFLEYEIQEPIEADFGLEFAPLTPRRCGNKCIFCFTDQNPPGLRPTLYFKDEDYRFSFLHGNYVTLTNASWKDLHRIAEQRLAPLYISVHATEPELRKKIFGLQKDDRLLEKISFLTRANIELHAQVVLCPGLNDGIHLQLTIWNLMSFYPQLKTVAIVPVGLTRYRQGLPHLKAFTPRSAAKVLDRVNEWGQFFLQEIATRFVYLADEFFLLAQRDIPDESYYEAFDQLENGVGMVRSLESEIASRHRQLPKRIERDFKVILVTGELAHPVILKLVNRYFRAIENLNIQVIAIRNEFFGPAITVSGLLTGQDIYNQLRSITKPDEIWLPPNCLNHDGFFLDNWTPSQLELKLGCRVHILAQGFVHRLTEFAGADRL